MTVTSHCLKKVYRWDKCRLFGSNLYYAYCGIVSTYVHVVCTSKPSQFSFGK